MYTSATTSSNGTVQHCPQCGAALQSGAEQCWLCFADLGEKVEWPAQPERSAAKIMETAGGFSLSSLMMFVTLVCVVLGVSALWPGIGIPLGLVLLLVWVRTAAVARRRETHGLSVTRAERAQLFLASFGATLALLAVVCVAGCAAYFAACFACLGTWAGLEGVIGDDAAELLAYIVYGAVALAIAVPTLWWIVKVVRRRWRRDIGEDIPLDRTQRRQ